MAEGGTGVGVGGPVRGPGLVSLALILLMCGAVGSAGQAVGGRLAPGAGWSAWVAVGVVAGVFGVGLVVMRVWRARAMDAWMRAYLVGQGARFVAAIAAAVALLYSLPPSARGVGGVTFAVAYVVTLMAESWVTAGHFRRALGARAEPTADTEP